MRIQLRKSSKTYEGLRYRHYHDRRLYHPSVKFSLNCRINGISFAISELFQNGVDRLLDLGSADGLLAKGIKALGPDIKQVYALDMDWELLQHNPFPSVRGDCRWIPFGDDTFDVITAAALIEHLPDPVSFLKECHRVLKTDGAVFLTSPAPFFEWVATKIGYLKNSGHLARFTLADIRRLCESAGLRVVLSRKFMISPVHVPGHAYIESLMRKLGFSFLMLNQVVGSVK